MLSAVDYSVFKSRDYSGANPFFPQQQFTKSALKTPPPPQKKVFVYMSHWLKNMPNKWIPSVFLWWVLIWQRDLCSRRCFILITVHAGPHKGHILNSCNFRCTGHSRRWQGWPKRRTWGDRSSRRPWSIRSEGTLRASWTLWPINLFKQNSSCLHVWRKEVCKLQKSLKSQLTDKVLITSCYQDHVSGLLQKCRCGAVQTSPSETMDSKKRHKGKQRHGSGVE